MIRFVVCFLTFLPGLVFAAPLTAELLTEGLQKDPSLFQSVEIKDTTTPVDLNLKLKPGVLKIGEADFDGFRFKAPAGSEAKDWVWYFNIPANWANWYIVPVRGQMSDAFVHWITADKLYEKFDLPGENDRLRALQSLPAGYFKPGQEYLVWFRMVKPGPEDNLRARISFAPKDSARSFESYEKSLALKPMDTLVQLDQLHSRGGKILLDKDFFETDYAEKLIDSLFSSNRQAKMLGVSSVNMEVAVPPSRNQPPYQEIRKKYGEADFIQTSEESKKAWLNQGYKENKADTDEITTYYYDYFGFEVLSKSSDEKIRSVVTTSTNYADLLPKENGDAFGSAKNLTIFYHDKKEVGRFYNFLQGDKIPLCIQAPPPGKYMGKEETLEYLGSGKWIWLMFHENGAVARRVPVENNLIDGKIEGFFPSGKIKYSATYRQGRLESEILNYSEAGELIKPPASAGPRPLPVSP